MPRPAINLEPYKDQIISDYQNGATMEAIRQSLQANISVSNATVTQRLREWGIEPHMTRENAKTALSARVIHLVTTEALSDSQILPILRRDGYKISANTLRRMRLDIGLRRRTDGKEQQQEQFEQIRQILIEELQIGDIVGYGRNLLYYHLRRKGYVFPRDRVFAALKEVHPRFNTMKEPELPLSDNPNDLSLPGSKQLRFLVIGAGSRGNAYARAVTKATSGVIHAVAEPHTFKRDEFGRNYIWGAAGSPSEGQEFNDWRDWIQWEVKRRQQCPSEEHNGDPTIASSSQGAIGVDGVFVCTLDETHVEIVQALAPLKLHILCEKPLALSLKDCLTVYRTLQPPEGPEKKPRPPSTIFSIGHVLRYSPHNTLLRKLLLEDRVIGDIVSLEHCEPVGWWHFSHSYVRGNWRRITATGDGSLLTKSCHDIDFILWLLCSPPSLANAHVSGHQPHFPRTISSAGSLTQFRRARKPAAAQGATNCLSCPAERECNYSAVKVYKDRHLAHGHTGWPVDIVCPDIEDVYRVSGPAAAESHLLTRLREDYDRRTDADSAIAARPWYGRCVYEADNSVCDDQVVTMAWDDEEGAPYRLAKTAHFHMIAPTEKQCERRGRVYGTTGEIEYDSRQISIYDFSSARTSVMDVPRPPPEQAESHGGGDYGLARQFVSAVEAVVNGGLDVETAQARFVGCTLEEAVRSHAVVFAAEEARREEKVVRWKEWWSEKLKKSAV